MEAEEGEEVTLERRLLLRTGSLETLPVLRVATHMVATRELSLAVELLSKTVDMLVDERGENTRNMTYV